jgi:hypothetical protein
MIDKQTKEIRQDDDKTVYKSLEEIADDLPDHSPRFVLLSYPLTLVRAIGITAFRLRPVGGCDTANMDITQSSGRLSVPYVLLYYLPITCNSELRMLYASAKELMRNTSEVGRVIDIESTDDLEEIPEKLGAT